MTRPSRLWVAACGWLLATAACADSLPLPMIDAHAHYSESDAAAFPPEAVRARLDAAGVDRLVATGSPPHLARHLYQSLPGRVIPLLGVYEGPRGKANWMHDAGLPGWLATQLQDGAWAGIGELHLFARDRHAPVFEQVMRLAAEHRVVVMLHGDAEVIEQAFKMAPGVRILWAHLGTDPEPGLLAAMLERFPDTLWIDTSVRDERIAPNGTLLAPWRALFERYPERFVVAVDTYSVNRWRHYGNVVSQIRAWTAALPHALKQNVLHDNAARLFESFLQPRPSR